MTDKALAPPSSPSEIDLAPKPADDLQALIEEARRRARRRRAGYAAVSTLAALLVGGLFVAFGGGGGRSAEHARAQQRTSDRSVAAPNRHLGTVSGASEMCVPWPPPLGPRARCRVYTGTVIGNGRPLDAVAVKDLAGKTVTTAKLIRGRFTVRVKPGRYRVALLFTARHRKPLGASPILKATVQAERTTRLVFKGYSG